MNSRLNEIGNWPQRAAQAHYHATELARNSGVCLRELEYFFAQEYHRTPQDWLNRLRLHEALPPLAQRRRIKGLAYELGYKHPRNFSRAFKKFYGISPTDASKLFTKNFVLRDLS
jgi:AraC-like DNA-binding protein